MASAKANSGVAISRKDPLAVLRLYRSFRKNDAKLVSPGGRVTALPVSLHDFLAQLTGQLNEAHSVSIVESDAKLTTVDAAAILGTSRQFLVNLLEKGEIPFHKVGTHRRIYARDLFQYKIRRDADRRSALRDLARHEANEGLYGREPKDAL